MKKNRVYIFLLICLFANALIFLVKILLDEQWQEVLNETLISFPLSISYVWAIFYIRKWMIRTSFYKSIEKKGRMKIWLFWSVFVSLKVIITSIPLRILVLFFFDDDDSQLFDLGFLAICAAALLTIVFVYLLESFLESEHEKQEIIIRLSKYEYEKSMAKYLALKKQLNPHFLFNSFNSLAALVETNHENASLFIDELSNIYRYTLAESEEVVVTLEKEIQLINSYFKLQKIRHGDSIEICIEVPVDKLNWLIPPMTLELLVENALKHNMFSKTSPLDIRIGICDNYLLVTNQYRLKPFMKGKDSTGIGIKSLINQYDFLCELKPEFLIENEFYIAKIPLLKPEL